MMQRLQKVLAHCGVGSRRECEEIIEQGRVEVNGRVVTRLGHDLPPALADPVQVHQALVNLILNGIQAMPSGGELEVATAGGAGRIEITVRDHGVGLPEGPVDRLFEPFVSTRPGGTGLGLAVTRQIAASHGGRLSAQQAEGGGALFRLELPAHATETAR